MRPELLTDFIKGWTWDLGTNLIGCAEAMNPRRFPAPQVLSNLRVWRQYIDLIIEETERAMQEGGAVIVSESFDPIGGDDRGLPGVLLGVQNSWFSDVTQRYLDREIAEARQAWRARLRAESSMPAEGE